MRPVVRAKPKFNGTIHGLCLIYKADPESGFTDLQQNTQSSYQDWLKIIRREHRASPHRRAVGEIFPDLLPRLERTGRPKGGTTRTARLRLNTDDQDPVRLWDAGRPFLIPLRTIAQRLVEDEVREESSARVGAHLRVRERDRDVGARSRGYFVGASSGASVRVLPVADRHRRVRTSKTWQYVAHDLDKCELVARCLKLIGSIDPETPVVRRDMARHGRRIWISESCGASLPMLQAYPSPSGTWTAKQVASPKLPARVHATTIWRCQARMRRRRRREKSTCVVPPRFRGAFKALGGIRARAKRSRQPAVRAQDQWGGTYRVPCARRASRSVAS
jgi:hypothetical protein